MILTLLAATAIAAAQSPLTVAPAGTGQTFTELSQIHYAFGPADGTPPAESEFRPLPNWHLGTNRQTLWLKFALQFPAGMPANEPLYIEVDERPDSARLYTDGGEHPLATSGALLSLKDRAVNNQRILLRLMPEPGQTRTYKIAITSVLPYSGELLIHNQATLDREDFWRDLKFTGYACFICAMLLINLLLYIYTRERLYLAYAFVQPWYLIFPAWELGYGFVLFSDIGPHYQFLGNLNGSITTLVLASFAMVFANLRQIHPKLYWLTTAVAGSGVVLALILPFASAICSALAAIALILLFGAGWTAVRRGDLASRYWTLGIGIVLLAGLFYILVEQGVWDLRLDLEDIVTIASLSALIDSFCFTLSVSARLSGRARQLTERQNILIRRLEEERQAAEVSALAKEQFLTNTNHELQTPLTAMIGFCDMIIEKMGEPVEHAKVIRRSAARLTQILRDVVDFSSTKRGTLSLSVSDFDACAVAAEVTELLQPEAQRKHVDLINGCATGLTVHADRARVRQILWNLIGNAVRFTERGEIRIGTEGSDDKCVRIFIRDTGQGIDPELQEHVFTGFKQADGSTRRSHQGMGLGLALSRELAQIQGGDVRLVRSEPGRGSEFEVLLPTPQNAQVLVTQTQIRAAWFE